MNIQLFDIGSDVLKIKAEADFGKNTITIYFAEGKIDSILQVMSKAEVPCSQVEDLAVSITSDSNIRTALHALVAGNLLTHDWMSEIITHFPQPDYGWRKLSGESFFKSDKEKEHRRKVQNIEAQLDSLLETKCSFFDMGSFGGSNIYFPKETSTEKMEEYVQTLQEANITNKIVLGKEPPCLKTNKKESIDSLIDKLENANRLKKESSIW